MHSDDDTSNAITTSADTLNDGKDRNYLTISDTNKVTLTIDTATATSVSTNNNHNNTITSDQKISQVLSTENK